MHTKVGNLSDLRFNLETWRRELRFHYDEMDTFQEKLEETVTKKMGHDAQKDIENFQNRIMIEKDAISKLKHRVRSKKRDLTGENHLQNGHGSLREDMRTYIKLHYDLKEEMMDFFSEYLR